MFQKKIFLMATIVENLKFLAFRLVRIITLIISELCLPASISTEPHWTDFREKWDFYENLPRSFKFGYD